MPQLILWGPNQGKRPGRTFINQLTDDSRIRNVELARALDEINNDKESVRSVQLRTIRSIQRCYDGFTALNQFL